MGNANARGGIRKNHPSEKYLYITSEKTCPSSSGENIGFVTTLHMHHSCFLSLKHIASVERARRTRLTFFTQIFFCEKKLTCGLIILVIPTNLDKFLCRDGTECDPMTIMCPPLANDRTEYVKSRSTGRVYYCGVILRQKNFLGHIPPRPIRIPGAAVRRLSCAFRFIL